MTDLSPIRVAFLLFRDVTQLDLTGPAQVLSRLGNATVDLVAKSRDPVPTDAGFALLPTASFADAAQTDILCVPGGVGDQAVMEDEESLAWVRQAAAGRAVGDERLHRRADPGRGGAAERISRDDALGLAPTSRAIRRDPRARARGVRPQPRDRGAA